MAKPVYFDSTELTLLFVLFSKMSEQAVAKIEVQKWTMSNNIYALHYADLNNSRVQSCLK